MKLGEKQVLTVVKIVDFGVYLGNDEERVLLPKKQVPDEIETVKEILKRQMETAASLDVPLIADMQVGKNWYEAK